MGSSKGSPPSNHVSERSQLKKHLILVLALVVLAAGAANATADAEAMQGLGQRLVRRNFLRFGKRSGPAMNPVIMMSGPVAEPPQPTPVKRKAADEGEGEQYETSVMSGQHPHKSNTRSFLRFGKRADNFLRFGKSSMHETSPDDQQYQIYYGPAWGAAGTGEQGSGDWESRLLRMLSRLNQGDGDDNADGPDYQTENYKLRHQQEQLFNQIAEKKANDFLRFGRQI